MDLRWYTYILSHCICAYCIVIVVQDLHAYLLKPKDKHGMEQGEGVDKIRGK